MRPWLLAVAVGLLAALVAAPGIGVRATEGAQLTADEPHYLLTTISLTEDGDLDVSDELADERWRDFHAAPLPIQQQPLEDGRQLSPHDPLLSVLLVPGWVLAGWQGAKATLVLLAGVLAALTTWTATTRFGTRPPLAAAVIAGLSVAWPLSGYASQLYPELPAALATIATVAIATAPGPPGPRRVFGVVLALTTLPWLAVKYVPVAAALGVVLAWRWWRDGHRRVLAWAVGALAASGVVYLAAHQAMYGGWTVYAAADHFVERGEFAVVGFDPNLPGRARRLVGLLVDRDFGLAAWQPLWLLAVPAVTVLLRRRPGPWPWLVVPLAAGWLTATFVALTMQGWWLPGRQVVVVLPLAAVALARWLDRAARPWWWAAGALGLLGVVSHGWLVVDGLQQRLTWVVDFASVGDPLYALRRAILPNYLRVSAWGTWGLQALWLAVLGLVTALAVRDSDRQAGSTDSVPVASTSSSA